MIPSPYRASSSRSTRGLGVEALGVGERGELDEVAVARWRRARGARGGSTACRPGAARARVAPVARRDVRLHADDRLDAGLLRAFSWNSQAPCRLPWSVIASAGCSNSCARAIRSSMRLAPSSREYSEWQWRWTKDIRRRKGQNDASARLEHTLDDGCRGRTAEVPRPPTSRGRPPRIICARAPLAYRPKTRASTIHGTSPSLKDNICF